MVHLVSISSGRDAAPDADGNLYSTWNGGESVTNHPDTGGNLYSTWMGVNQSLLTRIQVEGPFIWHFCLILGNMLLERYILMCWNMKIGFLSSYFNCMILFSSYLAFPMVKHGCLVGDGSTGDGSTVSCKSFLIVHLKAMIVNRKGVYVIFKQHYLSSMFYIKCFMSVTQINVLQSRPLSHSC